MAFSLQAVASRVESLAAELSHFPWRTTAQTLRERFREDHLGLTASSLTFTTILALVPSVLAGGIVSAPLVAAGWAGSQALGGATTSGGIAALSVSVMLALVAVYCVLCTLLTPVAVLINAFAINYVSEV